MEVIKIKDEHKKVADEFKEAQYIANVAFQEASKLLKEANGNMWKFLHEHYPKTVDYNCSYNYKSGEITLRYLDIKTD